MTTENKQTIAVVAVALVAFTALGFMTGFIFGTRKEKKMVVTPKGKLKQVEVD